MKSIFFGGGTPSLMKPFVAEGIINHIAKLGVVNEDTEITLEANPTSYETDKFIEFRNAGVNRVSIGVQSLSDHDLEQLGRKHSGDEAIKAISSAANLFDRYSFDLIYARQNQTLKDWQQELKAALKLANGHISLYQLTIEKGTPFYRLFKDGKLILPEEDIGADMYEWTNDYLKSNGYNRYEISNYAISGQECQHNLAYWNYEEYLGIGPGAHSRLHNTSSIEAMMMIHNPGKWLDSVYEVGHGIQSRKPLTQLEIVEEILMMGMRLEQGIDEKEFLRITRQRFDDVLDMIATQQYTEMQLLIRDTKGSRLTTKGLILHNYLVPRMIKRS